MKIYRVCWHDDGDDSPTGTGQAWFSKKADAEIALKGLGDRATDGIDSYDVEPTKAGVVNILNRFAKWF